MNHPLWLLPRNFCLTPDELCSSYSSLRELFHINEKKSHVERGERGNEGGRAPLHKCIPSPDGENANGGGDNGVGADL